MLGHAGVTGGADRLSLDIVLAGLDGGYAARDTGARFTSAEQLKAEGIIAFTFRPTVEECLDLWFGKSQQTDADIWRQFGEDVALATNGTYDHWALNPDYPRMLLALILLLDQFRRNMYRETPEMYAADPRCLTLVKRAIRLGATERLRLIERVFPCLVLTHSEDLPDHHLCMQEWEKVEAELEPTDPLRVFHEIFDRHLRVIERFGRFPHRNALLGRPSTPEEDAFLENAEFRFDLPLVKRPDGSFCFQGKIQGRKVGSIEGDAVSLAYAGPDAAVAKAEAEIRRHGYARVGDVTLRKFIVEREMPDIGAMQNDEMRAGFNRSSNALRAFWPRLTWVESYVCNDKMYCVYMADSAETLRKHALLAGLPIDSAYEVRQVISPETLASGN